MAQCIVIADDLTGANATGVLLTKMNYQAYTVMNPAAVSPETIEGSDCVLYPTDSRGISPEEAYQRTYDAVKLLASPEVVVYGKRIDSTLRGNLGRETDAMLDFLGEEYIALAAPCFPTSGRIVSGGYLLVDGIPLHKTNIAIDPKTPVHTSDVAEVFRQQSHYPVASLKLGDMMDGKHALADKINALAAEGARIITFDCVTQEDLDLIADAAITSKQKFFCVDPGVFTASCARKIIRPREKKEKHRILAVVGSVNPNTTAQMEELWLNQHPIYNVFVETKKLLESEEEREAEISRVTAAILEKALLNTVLTVTGDGIYPKNRIDFGPYMERDHCSMDEVTERINRSLAEIAWRILHAEPSIQGLYSSGGDVTQSIFRRFSAAGLMLRDEVLPLAAYGQFFGGDFDGLSIVTKGGSQGGPNAINVCVNYLKEKLYI